VLEDQVFIATGAAIFHGAHLGRKSEVRVHAIVHLCTRLEPGKDAVYATNGTLAFRAVAGS
jgi:carbonic anhydrase/acetyltransferase-like protein (isoleucine patch superfamily)